MPLPKLTPTEEQRFDLRAILEQAPRATNGAALVYVIVKDETPGYRFCEVFVINFASGKPEPMHIEGLIAAVTPLSRVPMFSKIARRAGTLKIGRGAAYASDEIESELSRAVFGAPGRLRLIAF